MAWKRSGVRFPLAPQTLRSTEISGSVSAVLGHGPTGYRAGTARLRPRGPSGRGWVQGRDAVAKRIVVAMLGCALVLLAGCAGDPDGGLGRAGVVITDAGGIDQAQAVAGAADGRLVVVGASIRSGGATRFVVARYLSDGTLDQSWGGRGLVTLDPGVAHNNGAEAVFLAPDG